MGRRKLDIQIGSVYGDRTVLSESDPVQGKSGNYQRRFVVVCKCGREDVVYMSHLTSGKSNKCHSCGSSKSGLSHGLMKSSFWNAWSNMLQRCNNVNNPNFFRYGGRGIKVCDEWLVFENFRDDMLPTYSDGLTLERRDNNQGYSKENCEWVTMKEQSRNKSSNKLINYQGVDYCLTDLANKFNLTYGCLKSRLDSGMPLELALSPISFRGKKLQEINDLHSNHV